MLRKIIYCYLVIFPWIGITIFYAQLDNSPLVISDCPDQLLAEVSTLSTYTLDSYASDQNNLDNKLTWTTIGQTNPSGTITNTMASITETSPEWKKNFGSDVILWYNND